MPTNQSQNFVHRAQHTQQLLDAYDIGHPVVETVIACLSAGQDQSLAMHRNTLLHSVCQHLALTSYRQKSLRVFTHLTIIYQQRHLVFN